MISHSELKRVLHYCPRTGIFRWRVDSGRAVKGNVAGHIRTDGYVQITINKRLMKGHRVAWFYMTGEWPKGRLDHRDGVQSNNKWKNLRPASHSQNMANRKLNKNSGSGFKGVSRRGSRYRAYINKDGQRQYLGNFDDAATAHAAYLAASIELHGEFARAA